MADAPLTLSEARDEIESLRHRSRTLRQKAEAVGERVVRSVVVAGTSFANGYMRGRYPTKSKIMGAPAGVIGAGLGYAAQAFGLTKSEIPTAIADGLAASEATISGMARGVSDQSKDQKPAGVAGVGSDDDYAKALAAALRGA